MLKLTTFATAAVMSAQAAMALSETSFLGSELAKIKEGKGLTLEQMQTVLSNWNNNNMGIFTHEQIVQVGGQDKFVMNEEKCDVYCYRPGEAITATISGKWVAEVHTSNLFIEMRDWEDKVILSDKKKIDSVQQPMKQHSPYHHQHHQKPMKDWKQKITLETFEEMDAGPYTLVVYAQD